MKWRYESERRRLKLALEDIYMIAKRRRAVVYTYDKDDKPRAIGPESTDENWDKIIAICEKIGLSMSILRVQDSENRSRRAAIRRTINR